MFKKLIVTGAAAAMVFGAAAGAFASTHVTNHGDINNQSWSVANTGLNYAGGHHSSVRTGDAASVQFTANGISTSADSSRHSNTTVKNYGNVDNTSVSVANTGLNGASHGSVRTGDAFSGQGVVNVVNTSVN